MTSDSLQVSLTWGRSSWPKWIRLCTPGKAWTPQRSTDASARISWEYLPHLVCTSDWSWQDVTLAHTDLSPPFVFVLFFVVTFVSGASLHSSSGSFLSLYIHCALFGSPSTIKNFDITKLSIFIYSLCKSKWSEHDEDKCPNSTFTVASFFFSGHWPLLPILQEPTCRRPLDTWRAGTMLSTTVTCGARCSPWTCSMPASNRRE